MAKTEHMELPLHVVDSHANRLNKEIRNQDEDCIAVVFSSPEDAELIVTAVNNHDRLLEALKILVAITSAKGNANTAVVIRARAAIQAVEEG